MGLGLQNPRLKKGGNERWAGGTGQLKVCVFITAVPITRYCSDKHAPDRGRRKRYKIVSLSAKRSVLTELASGVA